MPSKPLRLKIIFKKYSPVNHLFFDKKRKNLSEFGASEQNTQVEALLREERPMLQLD